MSPVNGTLLLLCVAFECHALPPCATTIAGLRALVADDGFPVRWLETSMDDGKPLVLSIVETEGALRLEFVKTGEGLWAESAGSVCAAGDHLEVRFGRKQVRFGPGSRWTLRAALAGGGKFTVMRSAAGHLRVATVGWNGTFAALQ